MGGRYAWMAAGLVLCGLCVRTAGADELSTLKSQLEAWQKDAASVPEGVEAPDAAFPRLLSYEMGTASKASIGGRNCVICIVTCRFAKKDSDETVEYRGTFLVTPSRLTDSGFSLKTTWTGPLGAKPVVDEGEKTPTMADLWPKAVEYDGDERRDVHVAVFGKELHEEDFKPKDEFEGQEHARKLEALKTTIAGKLYAAEFRHPADRGLEVAKSWSRYRGESFQTKPLFYQLAEYDFDRKVLPVMLLDQALYTREKGRLHYAKHYVGFAEVLLPVDEEDAKSIKRDEHKLIVFVLFRVKTDAGRRGVELPSPFRRPTVLRGQAVGTIPIIPEALVVYDKDSKKELLRWSLPAKAPEPEKGATPGKR